MFIEDLVLVPENTTMSITNPIHGPYEVNSQILIKQLCK